MSKTKSYADFLKESVRQLCEGGNEFTRIPDVVDKKGPFLDGILSYDGGGEMVTNKTMDISAVLERYYFKQDSEKVIQEDSDPPMPSEENIIPPVPESNISAVKGDIEQELTEQTEEDDESSKSEDDDEKESDEEKDETIEESSSLALESQILEKLISELESIDSDGDTEAAGKAGLEKELKGLEEQDESDSDPDDEEDEKDQESVDVDEELKESAKLPHKKITAEDPNDDATLEETFKLFRAAILSE